MPEDTAPFEKHYRVSEVARMWGLGRETIRQLFKDEPGVLKVKLGKKGAHTSMSIPASIVARVHMKRKSN